jgi:hypothetical protein
MSDPEHMYSLHVFDHGGHMVMVLLDQDGENLTRYEVFGKDFTDCAEKLADRLARIGEPNA